MKRTPVVVFGLVVVVVFGLRLVLDMPSDSSQWLLVLVVPAVVVGLMLFFIVFGVRRQKAEVLRDNDALFAWWTTAPPDGQMANGVLAGAKDGTLVWEPSSVTKRLGFERRAWNVGEITIGLTRSRLAMRRTVLIDVLAGDSSVWRGYVSKPDLDEVRQRLVEIGCAVQVGVED